MLTFHITWNKRLERKHLSVKERAITVGGYEWEANMSEKNLPKKHEAVFVECFSKFQPRVALVALSFNAEFPNMANFIITIFAQVLLGNV